MPGEEITFTAQPKIKSQSQIFRYGRSIFCLPHRPKISDFFDLCLRWVFVVRGFTQRFYTKKKLLTFLKVKSLKSNTVHCWRMKWQTRPRAKPRATKHLVSGGFGQNYLFFCFCLPAPKSPLLLPLLWHHLLVWPQLWSWRECTILCIKFVLAKPFPNQLHFLFFFPFLEKFILEKYALILMACTKTIWSYRNKI